MKEAKEECLNCRFWVEERSQIGTCRKNAPVIVDRLIKDGPKATLLLNVHWASCWPETSENCWCGEWEEDE